MRQSANRATSPPNSEVLASCSKTKIFSLHPTEVSTVWTQQVITGQGEHFHVMSDFFSNIIVDVKFSSRRHSILREIKQLLAPRSFGSH